MTIYYVATNGDNGNTGTGDSAGAAWRDVGYALKQLGPGDELQIRAGTYTDAWGTMSAANGYSEGTAANPILVRNYPGETPSLQRSKVAVVARDYWQFSGLVFEKNSGGFEFGEWSTTAEACTNWTFSNCTFQHMTNGSGLTLRRACTGFAIEDCTFFNIRGRLPWTQNSGNWHGILGYVNGMQIKRCTFTDIGGDGVQVSNGDTVSTDDMLVEDCTFQVRRPYVYTDENGVEGGTYLGNVGENGCDVKSSGSGTTKVTIRGCTFRGFQPVTDATDASGAFGVACKFNRDVDYMTVERCLFEDNLCHIEVNNDRPGVIIRHNIFLDVQDDDTFYDRGTEPTQLRMQNPEGGYRIENNTFLQTATAANRYSIRVDGAVQDLVFKNNIVEGGLIDDSAASWTNDTWDYNCWFNVGTKPTEMVGANDETTDPNLNAEYYPVSPTPVEDAGDNTLGWTDDYYGRAIVGTGLDIGAVEIAVSTPLTYRNDGDLPGGISFDTATGVYSGTLNQPGTYNMTTTAVNAEGEASDDWIWTVSDSIILGTLYYKMDEGGGDAIVNYDPGTGAAGDGTWDDSADWTWRDNNSSLYPMNDQGPYFEDTLYPVANTLYRETVPVGDGVDEFYTPSRIPLTDDFTVSWKGIHTATTYKLLEAGDDSCYIQLTDDNLVFYLNGTTSTCSGVMTVLDAGQHYEMVFKRTSGILSATLSIHGVAAANIDFSTPEVTGQGYIDRSDPLPTNVSIGNLVISTLGGEEEQGETQPETWVWELDFLEGSGAVVTNSNEESKYTNFFTNRQLDSYNIEGTGDGTVDPPDPPPTPPAGDATMLFEFDFDDGTLYSSATGGWSEQNAGLDGTVVLTSHLNGGETINPRAGTHMCKFELTKSEWPRPAPDDGLAPRAQLIKNIEDLRIEPLTEYWIGWAHYFPLNYVEESNPENGEVYWQMHGTGGGGAAPPLSLLYKNNQLSFHYRAGSYPNYNDGQPWLEGDIYVWPEVPKGEWMDLVVQVIFAHDNQGLVRLWHNDTLVGERVGAPTYYYGLNGTVNFNTQPCYQLLSLYKSRFVNSTTNKTDSIIYMDEYKIAQGTGGYDLVKPGS